MTTVATNTSSASSSTAANLASGQSSLNTSYSTFLTLLTTQLKNQDPTSPLDTNAFTQQLVQMTGVQQQLLSNQLLQQLVNQSSGGQGLSPSVNLIGKTATLSTASNTLSGGQASWQYTLGPNATKGTATISNSAGTVVWTGPLTSLSSGVNTLTWNGNDSKGVKLPDGGTYTVSLTATDANGGSVSANPQITGVVTGVAQNSSGQTLVNIGGASAPIANLISVSS